MAVRRRLRRLCIAFSLATVAGCATTGTPEAAKTPADQSEPPDDPGPSATAKEPSSAGGPELSELIERYEHHPAKETFTGQASYYADSLAGNSTASGEPYEPKRRTAAHRKLPFGTVVRVTRSDTGAVTYAVVNDRGPFGPRGRIIDLSRAAATDLDMLRAGVAQVRVEVVERGAKKR
jgi:rare lipoprotein A (peptidoglycan hydrolase)